jgi:hypothetical protein
MANDKFAGFMSDELAAIRFESEELRKDLAAFNKECDEFDSPHGKELAAILCKGADTLTKREQNVCLELAKKHMADRKPFDDRAALLRRKFDAHMARCDGALAAMAKRVSYEERQLDQSRIDEARSLQGLISYGLSTGQIGGSDWAFAKACADDCLTATTPEARQRSFLDMANTLRSCRIKPKEVSDDAPLLAEFERLEGEELSAFYRSYKNEILRATERQRNA